MRPVELDALAFEMVNRIRAERRVEDSHVECKGPLPTDHAGSARQLAGHANELHGQPVVWLLGIDETTGAITPTTVDEVRAWLEQLGKRFQEKRIPHPMLTRQVATDDGDIVAVEFDTAEAPYLTRVGDTDRYEVPWRAVAGTRTARREQIVSLLLDRTPLPTFEVIEGLLTLEHLSTSTESTWTWALILKCYAHFPFGHTAAFPQHRCHASVRSLVTDTWMLYLPEAEFTAPSSGLIFPAKVSVPRVPTNRFDTVRSGDRQVVLSGPGYINVWARAKRSPQVGGDLRALDPLEVVIRARPAASDAEVTVRAALEETELVDPDDSRAQTLGTWKVVGT
jgi:hypothetical protein